MQIRVKEGIKIRDPITKTLLSDGEHLVEDTLFWRRIERDGDIVVIDIPAIPVVAKKTPVLALKDDK
jgi:hypothetical protein